jgi:hypothetical protein
MKRIPQDLLQNVIDNEGELNSGPVATMGVWRMAMDLKESRTEIARLNNALQTLAKTMRDNAESLRHGNGFANPQLQSERDASAHSMEFWAHRIEEARQSNV